MTLDELDAAYAAMTQGPYQSGWEVPLYPHDDPEHRDAACVYSTNPAVPDVDRAVVSSTWYDGPITGITRENARGFVALHNSFPALRDRLKRAEELLARAEQALLPLATAAQDAGVCVGCVTATELETARKVREEILAAIETQRATT